jgi:hypothetical protein
MSAVMGIVVPEGSGSTGRTPLRWGGAVLLVTTVVVFFFSGHRANVRCHQECFGAPPLDSYGSLTYEPGHAWTRYAGSWQWSVQHGLTQFALIAGLVGLAFAVFSERNPIRLYAVSVVALVAWVIWLLLSPATV